ncbi:MAG: alpha/beta fold hydrolase [Actinomycetaceae bacterium]|nr:alpha/beta fold hydrolase [Actinomycetaceae bacterium]
MTLIVATDGSSLGNPGPAGWAWFMDEQNWSAGALAQSTNNVGELLAVLDFLRQTRGVDEDVLIYADSQYVINALTKWRFNWKRKGWKKADGKPVANREIMEALDEELNDRKRRGISVTFEWVRGHANHEMNEKADDYARGASEAIRDGREVKTGPGFSHAPSAESSSPVAGSTSSPASDAPSLFSFDEGEPAQSAAPAPVRANATPARGNATSATSTARAKTAPVQTSESAPTRASKTPASTPAPVPASASTPTPAPVPEEDVPDHTRVSYRQHGVYVTEHRVRVPLDYADPSGRQIVLFARELTLDADGSNTDQPALIFMQGGPGGRGPRPGNFRDGWIGEALKTHRVILMDERGTGLSSRLDELTLSEFDSVDEQVDYVKHFRADSIVKDAERLRALINGGRPWASLGQSYGGFINTTYLSMHPEGLSRVYFTGGLPGLTSVDDIYRLTYRATAARNEVFFARYPADRGVLRDVLRHLDSHEELLPTGERLSSRRLRMLGMMLGTTTGFDQLHYFFEGPFVTVRGEKRLSTEFLDMAARQISMGASPMYALLHETIYAGSTPALQGRSTSWAASRLLYEGELGFRSDSSADAASLPADAAAFSGDASSFSAGSGFVGAPGFGLSVAQLEAGFAPEPDYDSGDPIYLTGEHIYPFVFEEDPALRPLRELAHRLADFTEWGPLYYPEHLASNEVPAAAAVYFEDMFVPTGLSLETAQLAGVRTWVTNEYQHDGLRADGARVLRKLMDLAEE